MKGLAVFAAFFAVAPGIFLLLEEDDAREKVFFPLAVFILIFALEIIVIRSVKKD